MDSLITAAARALAAGDPLGGDRVDAAHARNLEVRRLLLIGRLEEAERALAEIDPAPFPPASKAAHELVAAGIAIRRLRTKAARLIARGKERPLLLEEIEAHSP